MLTIRLTRKGKKNQPFFRVVVIDKKRSSTGGRAVEDLGYKNPLTKKVSIKKERVLYWISKGAKPSPSIHNLLVSEKIIDAKKINVFKKPKKSAEVKPAEAAAPVTETPPAVAAPATAPKEIEKPATIPEISPAPEEKLVEAPKEEKPAEEPKA